MRVFKSKLNCGVGVSDTPIVVTVIGLLLMSISIGNVICIEDLDYNGFKFSTLIVI